ncbi:MAG: DUF4190 domain-containing protein [Mycobacterium sp.]|nr:DUF4190 domain-containing protein [Mycobacterium sp.]MBV9722985.1 DUF4190 domain-containing protein [Mycobacterium sp.]
MSHPPFGDAGQNPPGDDPPTPVEPRAPLNYPEYLPPYSPHASPAPPAPPYGYPPAHYGPPSYGAPPGYGGPPGYGPPPGYPGPYDPYQLYPRGPAGTNGLAVGSLITSIAGVVLGIPLTLTCYIGAVIPLVGVVLGAVALGQIKRTNQQGRGLAIAGIVVGAVMTVLLVLIAIAMMTVVINRSPFR